MVVVPVRLLILRLPTRLTIPVVVPVRLLILRLPTRLTIPVVAVARLTGGLTTRSLPTRSIPTVPVLVLMSVLTTHVTVLVVLGPVLR